MIADALRRQADAFIDLADLAEHITRRQVEPRTRTAAVSARPGPARATPAEPFPEEPDLPEGAEVAPATTGRGGNELGMWQGGLPCEKRGERVIPETGRHPN